MKKYVKPELIYERYELSQNIAACAWDMNNTQQELSCVGTADETIFGFPMTGKLFASDRGCMYDFYGGVEEYCYHAGGEFSNIFQS